MSTPPPQHHQIPNFIFSDGTGPTNVHLAYLDINSSASKVALTPTCFRSRLALDLTFQDTALQSHRIIVVALFGNGESSSPSNMAHFPVSLRYEDCVRAQHELLIQHLNIEAIDVILGFSMGGQCAYHWTLMYPECVQSAVIICSPARTSRHNHQFLEGLKAALVYSADYRKTKQIDRDHNHETGATSGSGSVSDGLRAFGKAYSAWLTSPEWFEKEMYKSIGYETLGDWDADAAGMNYLNWHPDDLLAMLGMWQKGDVTLVTGDSSLQEALARLRARVLVMPSETDQYFRWEAAEIESSLIIRSTFKRIPSAWGHLAGLGYGLEDREFMERAIEEFLRE
ncbi:uncharacterized protein KD926_011312 [Aspergillus affinis]|uniref:uncharacterized protein n=1 Tax=Aspergillus affinis TaxID=1070780 RepID=UPI0022FE7818|nr:uncharacterized protein KD926_011312 [Aspergillus affinis]KAI9038074.1 hypothetical protein KD926_011312 [Aspergillus affinis]